jgi:hypothetical protein
MDKQPWHAVSACETLIVLLDVAHAVEQEELERYLAESLRQYAVAATVHRVALPIARDPENPPTTSLRPLLSLPEHTCVLPLRVVWRTSLEEKSSRPRPRDLLFGTRVARGRGGRGSHPAASTRSGWSASPASPRRSVSCAHASRRSAARP